MLTEYASSLNELRFSPSGPESAVVSDGELLKALMSAPFTYVGCERSAARTVIVGSGIDAPLE